MAKLKLSYPINLISQIADVSTAEEFNKWVNEIVRDTNIDTRFLGEDKVNIININDIDDFDRRIKDIIGKDSYIVIYRYRHGMTYERISEVNDNSSQTIMKKLDRIIRALRHPDNRIRLVLDIDYISYKNKRKEFKNKCDIKANFDEESIEFLNKNIRELYCFNTRERSTFMRNNIITIKDLVTYTETELCGLPGIGMTTVNHIKEVLADYGLVLGE